MSSAGEIHRFVSGAETLTAMAGYALVSGVRRTVQRAQDDAFVSDAHEAAAEWDAALRAERARTQELAARLADAEALAADLDEALAEASSESEVLRAEVADLRRRLLHPAA